MANNISGLKDGTDTLQMCTYVLIFHRNAYQSKVVELNFSSFNSIQHRNTSLYSFIRHRLSGKWRPVTVITWISLDFQFQVIVWNYLWCRGSKFTLSCKEQLQAIREQTIYLFKTNIMHVSWYSEIKTIYF